MINDLKIKIFSDGADLNEIRDMNSKNHIQGITTNPTLMRAAGVKDYEQFAKQALKIVVKKPLSLEVFDDDLDVMYEQAKVISSWGKNVYVKLPIYNTKKQFIGPVAKELSKLGIKLNITAVMTDLQVKKILDYLTGKVESIISVFAGRIADTGRDPLIIMKNCLKIMEANKKSELLWASPRETLNIYQADQIGCHIITVTSDLIKKLSLYKKELDGYSVETAKMFYDDALKSNFKIKVP